MVSTLRHPWHSMDAARFPHHALHGTPWWLTGLRSLDINVADKNRYCTSIHHVTRADQNCAVLKRAENITRRVEMWSVVRQQGTVRASRKMCSGLKGSVTKSSKFISRVKHQKQRFMLAFLFLFVCLFFFAFFLFDFVGFSFFYIFVFFFKKKIIFGFFLAWSCGFSSAHSRVEQW